MGGSGDDSLFGGLNNDSIITGAGSNTIQELTGATGAVAADDVVHTYTVSNTADSGPGSLRQAITDANADAAADLIVIDFQIGAGDANFVDVDSTLTGGDADPDAFVITPLSALPALNNSGAPIVINGHSQGAITGDTNPFGPEIVLDGNAGAFNGLTVTSNNNVIHGLNIQDFAAMGSK